MPLSGVVFDFDGVLADSEPLHLRAYQDILTPFSIDLTESDYYTRYLGFDDVGVFRAVAKDQGWVLTEALLTELVRTKEQRFDALTADGNALFPGAADCVRRFAAAVPVAVASGALRGEIEALLLPAGLRHHFKAIVASGETPHSKPAPDPYLRAVELLRPFAVEAGLDPNGCFVAIEDSNWGVESALAAGLRCVGVAQTYPADALHAAQAVVTTIGELGLETVRGVCPNGSSDPNRTKPESRP